MKKGKRFIAFMMAFVMLFVCSIEPVQAAGNNRKKRTVYVGKTVQLKINRKVRKLSWKSSNKRIATVNRKGKVTGRRAGRVTISTKYRGKKYSFKVVVKNPRLNKKKLTMKVGSKFALKLIGNRIKKCTSSDKTVVSVSSRGVLRAKKTGSAKIRIVGKNKKRYICRVTVINADTTITENPSTEAPTVEATPTAMPGATELPTGNPTTVPMVTPTAGESTSPVAPGETATSTVVPPTDGTASPEEPGTTDSPTVAPGVTATPEANEPTPTAVPTEAGHLKEFDLIQDMVSSFATMQTINSDDVLKTGQYDTDKKAIVENNNYMISAQAFAVEQTNYRVLTTDSTYRVRLDMFNVNQNYIGYYDCGNGDIYTPNSRCAYVVLSVYQYKNASIVEQTEQSLVQAFANGLQITFEKIEDLESIITAKEMVGCEVHAESLSNPSNFRAGTYNYSWGHNGEYASSYDTICTRNFYIPTKDKYIVNINDSRIYAAVVMYDANGDYLAKAENLVTGSEVNIAEGTAYIGLKVHKKQYSLDVIELLANGLRIDLADSVYIEDTPIVEMSDVDLFDIGDWKSGFYSYETGEYALSTDTICYKNLIKPDGKCYVANLPTTKMQVRIVEFDAEGNGIKTSNLQNGRKWTADEQTAYYGVQIVDTASEVLDSSGLLEALQQHAQVVLSEFYKYQYNTIMKDITAFDYVSEMNVGWNLGNSFDGYTKDSTRGEDAHLGQEMAWGVPYISKAVIDYVKECGFNTIRIPVTWYYNTYEDENGDVHVGKKWLDRVQDVVDYAIANDMKVILNTHHDSQMGAIATGVSDEEMAVILNYAEDIWTDIATYFKDYDEKLMFESYNEVDNLEKSWNYSDEAAAQMNQLNQVFVDAVRATGGNNDKRVLCVPTLLDGYGTKFYSGFEIPKDTVDNKIVLQVHAYPVQFDQNIEVIFEQLEKFSQEQNAPVIIGEFGTKKSYTISEIRAKQASNFVARAAARGIKCVWWDNNTDYGIINRNTVDCSGSDTEMIQALLTGASGVAYETPVAATLNTWDQFIFHRTSNSTGITEAEEYIYWGTLTTDNAGQAISVDTTKKYYSVSLKCINEADDIWLQYVLFYDKDGNFITAKDADGNIRYYTEVNNKYRVGAIPENAAYVRFTMNSATRNVKKTEYESYITNGDMGLTVNFFNADDVQSKQLAEE